MTQKNKPQNNMDVFEDIENEHKRKKFKWMLIAAISMCILGGVLMVIGLFLPPMGEIHPSVLTGAGEALTFSGSCFGISGNYQLKHERMMQDYRRHQREWEQIQEIHNENSYDDTI